VLCRREIRCGRGLRLTNGCAVRPVSAPAPSCSSRSSAPRSSPDADVFGAALLADLAATAAGAEDGDHDD
jgi:hypothetical protein